MDKNADSTEHEIKLTAAYRNMNEEGRTALDTMTVNLAVNHKPLTQKSTDHSDSGHFSFSFYCDCCESEWSSPLKLFTGGICSSVENDSAKRLLWGNEHRAAFNEANLEAHLQFNRCILCGKWVCDDCFCFEEKNGGKCKNCR